MIGILDVLKQQKTWMRHKKERKDLPFTGGADIFKAKKPYSPKYTMRGQIP